MPTIPSNDSENALVAEMIKLNKNLRRQNSWWRAFLRGMLTSVGTVIGVIIITAALGTILLKAVQKVDWNNVIQDSITRAITGGGFRNR